MSAILGWVLWPFAFTIDLLLPERSQAQQDANPIIEEW